MRTNFRTRIRIVSLAIVVFALVLVLRLYFIQVIHGEGFAIEADRQYQNPGAQIFDRGTIFFETKDAKKVSAATLKTGFILAIDPSSIKDIETTYNAINEIYPLDRASFFFKAGKVDDPYEEVGKRLDEEIAKEIESLGMPGVKIFKERWRFYPGGELSAHTVGFIGWNDNNKISGLYGIERYYDNVLVRNDGNIYVNFFAEIFLNVKQAISKSKIEKEGDILLSVEPTVQMLLEDKIEETAEKWGAKEVAGIIMDPTNGEINAMAVYPSYDLNNFKEVENSDIFGNPLVEDVYEMGSIIKPLTMAAGIDAGAVSAKTTYNDKGYLLIDGARISNFDKKGRGVVSMQEVLNQSLNTGVAFVMRQMGKERFADYMLAYGLGEETGIDLPNETRGLVENLESPREVEYATASFGQGIALTPISTIRALASLGNGGQLVTPHLVKKINYKTGFSSSLYKNENKQILKKETAEEITRMLVNVVDTALLSGQYKMDRYSIAAKTGTAEIADTENGGYYEDRFLHSFFGYFPAYNPRFIIFIYALEPHARYASETLTPPFMDMTKFLINYYGLTPDR
ncbi:MAG: penicillin-binding protein 2 [Patescibacteria group bacterium]